MVYDACQKNLTMVAVAAGTVTVSLCDSASTIVQQLFDVPETHAVLLGADSPQGLKVGANVFDSQSRLQVSQNKTRTNMEHRVWVVEGLYDMAKSGRLEEGISVLDLKGNQRASNRGLCDLLIFKHALKRQLFQRETTCAPPTS